MILTKRVGLVAGAAALTMTGASFADDGAQAKGYEARIAELEAQVARLSGDNWLTEERAEQVRGLVQDVLADADTRASLLQSSGVGYDNGFMIGSPDGNFSLKLNGQLQTRFVYNYQDDDAHDSNLAGFESPRTKLMFSGNAGDWKFRIQGNFMQSYVVGESGGSFELEDAWLGYDFGNGLSVYMGQGKLPFQREWLVDSSRQLAVERSTASYYQPGGRTQGILVAYEQDAWKLMASYNDGIGGANNAVVPVDGQLQSGSAIDVEGSVTARAEWLASGTWEQFEDFTSKPGSETGFLLGGAIHYQHGEHGVSIPDDKISVLAFTLDASLEMDAVNAFAAYTYANYDDNDGLDSTVQSIVVQGGIYLNDMWELFARYEWADLDTAGLSDLSLLTVGVNAFYSDNVKMTSDFGIGFDSVPLTNSITDVRADANDNDGQFIWRTQLQLTF